jgi:hypothetical protein
MIYLAAFSGICSSTIALRGAGILCALVLSLTGACAVVAFAKAVGGTFLGEPRQISEVKEESPSMKTLKDNYTLFWGDNNELDIE